MLNSVPPVATAYQLIVAPDVAVALRVTVPGPHLVAGVVPVMVGIGLMVATTAVRTAELQPAEETACA